MNHNCSERNRMEFEKLKLHFAYIVGFLVVAMIVISTGLWTDKDNFTEYLTNAATAISIVLGLVAIFYSFISNSSLSQSLGNISKVSEEVGQTKSQIENFLQHANELEKRGAENTSALKDISSSVENHVISLREALGRVTETTRLLQESVSGRFDKVEDLLSTSGDVVDKASKEDRIAGENVISEERVEDFLACSSLIGLCMLFGCVLANTSDKKFSIDEIGKIFEFDLSYMHGYFVAACAAGLINEEKIGGDNNSFKIVDIHQVIKRQAKKVFVERLESLYRKNQPDVLSKYQKDIATIENQFEAS
jgi:hypothetical protein